MNASPDQAAIKKIFRANPVSKAQTPGTNETSLSLFHTKRTTF